MRVGTGDAAGAARTFLRFFDSDAEVWSAWSALVVGIGAWLLPSDFMLEGALLEQCMCCGSSLRLVSDVITELPVALSCAAVISNFAVSCGTMLGMNGSFQCCVI